ncbi:MAG: arsenate reductase [Erythrobacter sp.]
MIPEIGVISLDREWETSRHTPALIRTGGLTPCALLRAKRPPFAGVVLGDPALGDAPLSDAPLSDAPLSDGMMAHPIPVNRPLAVSLPGVRLCRPWQEMLSLRPAGQPGAGAKQTGERIGDARGQLVQ